MSEIKITLSTISKQNNKSSSGIFQKFSRRHTNILSFISHTFINLYSLESWNAGYCS